MRKRHILGFVMLTLCSGCGTVLSHTTTQDTVIGPYSGVRTDVFMIGHANESSPDFPAAPWIIPFCIIDVPLSAALDTIFLPYDAFQHQPEANAPANKSFHSAP
jgi:uncharacterized protein YceK